MPRKRTVTARRTTTEEVTVTEEEALPAIPPVEWAHGWGPGPVLPRHDYLAQRQAQCGQALGLLALWDASAAPGEPVPGWLVRQAVTILRAGPGATPLELTLGRSI